MIGPVRFLHAEGSSPAKFPNKIVPDYVKDVMSKK